MFFEIERIEMEKNEEKETNEERETNEGKEKNEILKICGKEQRVWGNENCFKE